MASADNVTVWSMSTLCPWSCFYTLTLSLMMLCLDHETMSILCPCQSVFMPGTMLWFSFYNLDSCYILANHISWWRLYDNVAVLKSFRNHCLWHCLHHAKVEFQATKFYRCNYTMKSFHNSIQVQLQRQYTSVWAQTVKECIMKCVI